MVTQTDLARSIAPEDIQIGSQVMILHRQSQIMMGKCVEGQDPEVVVVPVVTRPHFPELPAKVLSVCLPFIVIKRVNEKSEIIDTRSSRIARVPKSFAKITNRSHLEKSKKKGKKKNKRRKRKK